MSSSQASTGTAGSVKSSKKHSKSPRTNILESYISTLINRLTQLEREAVDPSMTIFGLSVKQNAIDVAIKKLAKRVKVLKAKQKVDKKSKKDRGRMSDKLREQRDDWRRTAKTQERKAEAEKAELQETIASLKQENKDLFMELKPYRVGLAQFDELRHMPIFVGQDEMVASPIEDEDACRIARNRAFFHQKFGDVAVPPARAHTLAAIAYSAPQILPRKVYWVNDEGPMQ